MSASDDPFDEMARFLTSDLTEQLLAGDVGEGELPGRAVGLGRLLAAMSAPDERGDLVDEQHVVATIAAAVRSGPTDLTEYRQARLRHQRISARAAAVAVVVVLAGSTAAAAATGSLPAPAQRFISTALSHVDIAIPHPARHVAPYDRAGIAQSDHSPAKTSGRTSNSSSGGHRGNSPTATGRVGSAPGLSTRSGSTTTTAPAAHGSKPLTSPSHAHGPVVTTPGSQGPGSRGGKSGAEKGATGKSGAAGANAKGRTKAAVTGAPSPSSNANPNPNQQQP